MNAPILVTGGTGTIGRRVVPWLVEAGRSVRILTRHPGADSPGIEHVGGDTVTGRGVDAALSGVEVVLHLAGGAKGDDVAARTLVNAARVAGVRHIVMISVIGADRMPIGYFRAKAAAERTLAESGLPWTVLRVAQLHDFVLPIVRSMARLPLLPAPRGLRFEPVDRDEVAARLTALTLEAPAGRVPDLAGPEVLDIPQLAAAYAAAEAQARANGRPPRRRPSLPVRLPGAVGRAYRAGDNLADTDTERGHRTWSDFLAERVTSPVR
ncbi:NAD(P)H-binding protein [Herbiconiux sp. CPCC 205763]|uniref:NAD(P)H-binding protein n=1 Tax=Herbiconiux aconitum TaxID=2970913 RepID=A0ABT2GP75_9MICO|nr:NAD(P)H-binding protein [Herbiconiux aconitum]MCS5718025.1 NAD(P)H-binding protein [Herbiconiux aconitum]